MPRAVRLILTAVLTLLIGLLVLQAAAYGIGFAVDPVGNAGEFGFEAPDPVDELTVELVRLVGISMIGGAVLLAFSAILIWRATPAGAYLAMIIGGIYVVVALHAVNAEQWWGAGLYGITGAALIVLAGTNRWLQARPAPSATGPA
jgi:hypothetical protein